MTETDDPPEEALDLNLEEFTGEFPIRVRGLRNSFGEQVVHEGLELDVRKGEILGVVGGSRPSWTTCSPKLFFSPRTRMGYFPVNSSRLRSSASPALAAVSLMPSRPR